MDAPAVERVEGRGVEQHGPAAGQPNTGAAAGRSLHLTYASPSLLRSRPMPLCSKLHARTGPAAGLPSPSQRGCGLSSPCMYVKDGGAGAVRPC